MRRVVKALRVARHARDVRTSIVPMYHHADSMLKIDKLTFLFWFSLPNGSWRKHAPSGLQVFFHVRIVSSSQTLRGQTSFDEAWHYCRCFEDCHLAGAAGVAKTQQIHPLWLPKVLLPFNQYMEHDTFVVCRIQHHWIGCFHSVFACEDSTHPCKPGPSRWPFAQICIMKQVRRHVSPRLLSLFYSEYTQPSMGWFIISLSARNRRDETVDSTWDDLVGFSFIRVVLLLRGVLSVIQLSVSYLYMPLSRSRLLSSMLVVGYNRLCLGTITLSCFRLHRNHRSQHRITLPAPLLRFLLRACLPKAVHLHDNSFEYWWVCSYSVLNPTVWILFSQLLLIQFSTRNTQSQHISVYALRFLLL